MIRQDVSEAMDIRTDRQAESAGLAVQELPISLRSIGVGITESNFTAGTRAERQSSTGSLENDLWYETDTNWLYRWDVVGWAFATGVCSGSDATRTALTISAEDNGAFFLDTDTDTDMGLWQVSGGAWVKRFPSASVDLSTSYKVAGDKVLGTRGAAVAAVASADATDLPSAITLVNELKAQFNTFRSRFVVTGGHGSIAD